MRPLPRVVAIAITILVGLTLQSTSAQQQISQGKQAVDRVHRDAEGVISNGLGATRFRDAAALALATDAKRVTGDVEPMIDIVRILGTPVKSVSGTTPAGAKRVALFRGFVPRQRSL